MTAPPNLLSEETARAIERLQTRLQQHRTQLAGLAQDSWQVSKTVSKIEQMEKGLKRLQLYSQMLNSERSHTDKRLVRERDQFGKQYNRKWRPSRSPQIEQDDEA
ncbi:MAG TPA: hypothetical protein VKF35_16525 [Hyphomicrobiaceae bacterium]|nr:hypothetical protein [Hyphomicrobiaceae bacterium]